MTHLIIAILLTAAYGDPINVRGPPVTDVVYEDSYIVAVPRCIEALSPADMMVHILKGVSPVNVTVQLVKKKTGQPLASEQTDVQPGKPQIITLQVPGELVGRTSYAIKVTGRSSGINFTNMTSVELKSPTEKFATVIQTDLPIYNSKQTVHYRIFALNHDFKAEKNRTYTITIRNQIFSNFRTKRVVLDATGFIKGSLNLTNEVKVIGTWQIRAMTGGSSMSHSFEVKSALPTIEFTVTTPSIVVLTQSTVEVTVTAKYILGGDVRGKLFVDGHGGLGGQTFVPLEIDNFQGSATVTFSLAEILPNFIPQDFNYGHPLFFEVRLLENGTGIVAREKTSTTVYTTAEMMVYLHTNPLTFKPALSYTAYAKVTKPDGSPIDPQSEKLKVLVQARVENDNEGTLSKNSIHSPYRRQNIVNVTYMELNVPADGLVEINIQSVPREAKAIFLTSTYKCQRVVWSAYKSYSPSNSFIQIGVLKDLRQPGQRQKIELESNFPITSFSILVIARGRIVKTLDQVQRSASRRHCTSFAITHDMVPFARVVAYYRTANGEIVSDAIAFMVHFLFKNKVSISLDAEEARPGDNVTVTVRADPGSIVATHIVDKAVLLLDKGQPTTEERVMNGIRSLCSRHPLYDQPIEEDAYSVFLGASLTILTDSLLYSHSHDTRHLIARIAFPPFPGIHAFGWKHTIIVNPYIYVTPQTTKFPDIWLFSVEVTDANGQVTIPTTVPSSSTVWQATAFALNNQSGFGMTSEATTLKVV